MARATRQSARLVSKSSDTATPTSNASPYFSSRPESLVTGVETPITSDVEGDANEKASKTKNKRVIEVASDDEYSGNDNTQAPPAKRRAIANRSYVALERRTSARGKGKEKVFVLSLSCKFFFFLTVR